MLVLALNTPSESEVRVYIVDEYANSIECNIGAMAWEIEIEAVAHCIPKVVNDG